MEYKTLCTFLGKNYKANLINDSVLLRLCVHFWKKNNKRLCFKSTTQLAFREINNKRPGSSIWYSRVSCCEYSIRPKRTIAKKIQDDTVFLIAWLCHIHMLVRDNRTQPSYRTFEGHTQVTLYENGLKMRLSKIGKSYESRAKNERPLIIIGQL